MPRLALSKTYQLSLRTFEECRCPGDFLKGRQITWTGPGVQSQYERSTTRLVLLAHPVHYFRGQQRHTLLNKSAARSLKSSHEVIILSLQASDTLQARRAMEHKKRLSSIGERASGWFSVVPVRKTGTAGGRGLVASGGRKSRGILEGAFGMEDIGTRSVGDVDLPSSRGKGGS
ncbi:hypothetical protein AXG93_1998s1030 [Marchantia polymorpha subsp. ruderalis]|uniref:Uncharacterized protein n=1 Tax=Marchantia polymorpha subsp. ruderalis TaxID=1480154 RepID=A0A176VPT8_MARPO|nr:hypothetical protein AXG93_1998s1030 [Marchantia polymorpha subsp. ruderalis]